LLALEHIRKTYGGVVALSDLSLQVARGEFVVLLGPTGAGKTTTLRTVAGLAMPDRGRVLFDGSDVTALPPGARDVAFVFQNYCLYPKLTVFDNMAFPLRAPMRRLPEGEIRRIVMNVAEKLHIDHLCERLPSQLSGGEMQRVALGRAIVRRPRMFLMDEPLSNLDAKLREQMRVELKRLQSEQGSTTLYVTHDQTEAMSMADRLAVLHKGVIQQVGAPVEVYESPANMVVARLLGSPPMNLTPCLRPEPSVIDVGPGALTVALPAGRHMEVRGPATEGLVFGIRPEHVTLRREQSPGAVRVEAYVVQAMGAEDIISVRVGRTMWKVRVPTSLGARVGEAFWMTVDGAKAHLFGGRLEDVEPGQTA
jgi:multiple sugar transport system ATP-binding protein